MVKNFYKKIIAILSIVTIVFLSIGILNYFHIYEGLDTDMNSGEENGEVRAVSHLKKTSTPNAVGEMLSSTLQLYDPKLVADRINSTADQLTAIAQNVDSSKFAALYSTFIDKLNEPSTPSSKNGIISNATIANSYLNVLDNPRTTIKPTVDSNINDVVSSGPSSSINASTIDNYSPSTSVVIPFP